MMMLSSKQIISRSCEECSQSADLPKDGIYSAKILGIDYKVEILFCECEQKGFHPTLRNACENKRQSKVHEPRISLADRSPEQRHHYLHFVIVGKRNSQANLTKFFFFSNTM